MVQALANNINTTILEPVKTQAQDTTAPADFQLLFEQQTADTESLETVDEEEITANLETLITENTEEETEAVDTLVSELETEQVLSGMLQLITIPQTEETKTEQADSEEIPQTENSSLISEATTDFDTQITNTVKTTPQVAQTETKETTETDSKKSIHDVLDEEQLQELNVEAFEAEASSEQSGSDLMQNQTPQEQGIKALIQADVEFKEVKPTEVQAAQKPAPSQEANPSKIIEQISKQMEGLKSGSRVNMILNPESLGKVAIQLINTKEGLSAQFTVATQEARNLIMKGLDGLKETLLSHGVNIDNVSVKLSDTQESEYNPDWTDQEHSEGRKQQQNSKKDEKQKEQFEQMMSSLEENGNV